MKACTIRHLFWAAPVALFVAACATAPKAQSGKHPLAEIPGQLDLGDREQGEITVIPFTIANRGESDLLIDQVTSDCSCSGLEIQESGALHRVESLMVRAGESIDVVARMAVRGRPGEPAHSTIFFRTNEDGQPQRSVTLNVARVMGVAVVPTSLVFGELQMDAESRQVVEIRDLSHRPLVLSRVENLAGEQVAARVLSNGLDGQQSESAAGRFIARCEVVTSARQAGSISGRIRLHLTRPDGAMTVDVPISGQVVPAVSIAPSRVILPRMSEKGHVYEAVCVCRNRVGKPLALSLVSAPPGLSVTIEPAASSAPVQLVRLQWTPPSGAPATATRQDTVRLKAVGAGLEIPVEIAIELNG